MTERRFFITTCPQCRGTKVSNADHKVIESMGTFPTWSDSDWVPTIGGAERIPCPTCDARGKVIAQVMAPLMAEEVWA